MSPENEFAILGRKLEEELEKAYGRKIDLCILACVKNEGEVSIYTNMPKHHASSMMYQTSYSVLDLDPKKINEVPEEDDEE